jgi:hypothetical protein
MTTALAYLLISVAFLFVAGVGTFLLIVISIHRVDRARRLTSAPRTCLDAATRRVLGAPGCAPASRRHEEH